MAEYQQGNTLTFVAIVSDVFAHWKFHASTAAIILSLALFLFSVIKPSYDATAVIVPTQELDANKTDFSFSGLGLSLFSTNKSAPMSGFEQVLVSMVSNIVAKRLFADEKIRNHILNLI